jgi:hypothetical protein
LIEALDYRAQANGTLLAAKLAQLEMFMGLPCLDVVLASQPEVNARGCLIESVCVLAKRCRIQQVEEQRTGWSDLR